MRKILRVDDSAADLYELIQERISQSVGIDDAPLDLTKTFEEIRKDIHRTYLVADSALLREELFRVLAAIAYVKPSISYCQGMNFIVAVLLKVMGSEEVGFWMFLAMLKKFEMESMFVPGVPDLALREYQLNYYLKLNLPELSTHFRRVGVTNAFFVSRWFLTLFSVYLPYTTLLQVWDCFFLQGWKVLIKVGIALFSSIQSELLAADLDEISMVIRDTLRTQQLEPKALLQRAWRVHVSNAELQRMETQFFLDQTKIKLNAIEHTLGYSDSEINALRWAKSELESLDSGTQTNVKELQRKLEKIEKDLDWYELRSFYNHYLAVSMELLHVEHEMEALTEKKGIYQEALRSLESKFKRQSRKRFLTRLLPTRSRKNGIRAEDVQQTRLKLQRTEEELKCLASQHTEKVRSMQEQMFKDAKRRIEEIKERKTSYSRQLCGFINSLNSNL